MVSTTVGVIHRVHRHTTHNRPAVALRLVLVVHGTSLEHGLVATPATGNLPHGATAAAGDGLLGAGGELDAGEPGVGVVRHQDAVLAGRLGQHAAVAELLLHVADDGSLGHDADGQHVANHQLRLLPAVDELTRVGALRGDEQLLLVRVALRVAEGHPGERGATAGVVDDVGHDTLDVPMALGEVRLAELGRALALGGVRGEDATRPLTLATDNATHPGRLCV
mmetsp:Transcript_20562/g.51228  ORF Transcript_20562/g.51228 Transcript_20562/m.51228 type:complete len:223 (-) Transcript_20562:57-725(-)